MSQKSNLAFFLSLLVVSNSQAQSVDCGRVESVSGSSCRSLNVVFDLSKCGDTVSQATAKISCKGDVASASFRSSKFRYTAQLAPGSENWGTKVWAAEGPVSQSAVAAPAKPVRTHWEAQKSAPAVTATVEAPRVVAPSDPIIKVNGFIDTQFQWTEESTRPGFLINDGALYLAHEISDGTSAKVDLPFRGGDGANNNFTFATAKAQAYIAGKNDNGFNWKLGQFDTLFGFELNDSPDVTFTTQGRLFTAALPVTHTGITVGYANGPVTLNLLLSDPLNQGALAEANYEFGGQVLFNPSPALRLNAGYLGLSMDGGTRSLMDFIAGTTLDSCRLTLSSIC